MNLKSLFQLTWWLIPLSKWLITYDPSDRWINPIIPLITVFFHQLLIEMNHQVGSYGGVITRTVSDDQHIPSSPAATRWLHPGYLSPDLTILYNHYKPYSYGPKYQL